MHKYIHKDATFNVHIKCMFVNANKIGKHELLSICLHIKAAVLIKNN